MKNFAHPLAIRGTESELIGLIPELEAIGYLKGDARAMEYRNDDFLITDMSGINGQLGLNFKGNVEFVLDKELIDANKRKLILALARQTKEEKIQLGEIVVYLFNNDLREVVNEQIQRNLDSFGIDWCTQGAANQPNLHRRATKEEIINHFKPKQMEMKVVNCTVVREETRKIIGYKAPIDLFTGDYNGGVKKGDIYHKHSGNNSMYISKSGGARYSIAKEIVETWEPYYENDFIVGQYVFIEDGKSGAMGANGLYGIVTEKEATDGIKDSLNSGIIVDTGDGKLWQLDKEANVRKITKQEFEENNLKIGDHTVKFLNNRVNIGCQSFTKSQVEVVNYLLCRMDVKYELTADGIAISKETVSRILNKMK